MSFDPFPYRRADIGVFSNLYFRVLTFKLARLLTAQQILVRPRLRSQKARLSCIVKWGEARRFGQKNAKFKNQPAFEKI